MNKLFVLVLAAAFCTAAYDVSTDGPVWKGIKSLAPERKPTVKVEKQPKPVTKIIRVEQPVSPRCNGDTSYDSIMNDNKRMYAESIKMSAELNAARQEVQKLRASLDYYTRREQ